MTRYLLALDTATEVCGVALAVDGKVQVKLSLDHGYTHAKSIMDAVGALLSLAGLNVQSVDAFAATKGPGSFTGLRIGISTIKGLAMAVGKPLVGVSSLAVLAHQASSTHELVCPMLDARRKEVYWSLYRHENQSLVALEPEHVGPAESVPAHIHGPCLFIGSGARVYQEVLQKQLAHPAQWVPQVHDALDPGFLAVLAWRKIQEGQMDDVKTFAPHYLRRSDAEMSCTRPNTKS